MTYKQRDIAAGSEEDLEDRRNIVKRLQKLSELIPKETDREARAWLMREEIFLQNNGRLVDWNNYRAHLKEIERKSAAEYAKKEAARQAEETRLAQLRAEEDERIRRKIAEETDPVTLWRRQHSERTF